MNVTRVLDTKAIFVTSFLTLTKMQNHFTYTYYSVNFIALNLLRIISLYLLIIRIRLLILLKLVRLFL